MDVVSTSTTSSSGGPVNHRKERGNIAAQACETCRARKQKCDEAKPKCNSCQRMNLECRYREPQPTKKDNTLVEILNRIKSLESKFDRYSTTFPPLPSGFGSWQPSAASQPFFSKEVAQSSILSSSSRSRPDQQQTRLNSSQNVQAHHLESAPHKILLWPAVQQILLQSQTLDIGGVETLAGNGLMFLINLEQDSVGLSLEEYLPSNPLPSLHSQVSIEAGGLSLTFPELTREVMNQLAAAYFDSFNLIYPVTDKQTFIQETLTKVYEKGFDNSVDSLLALLVFALGELAIAGSDGTPLEVHKGQPSGFRGGAVPRKPPGIRLFNEARKRLGFMMTGHSLEHVQSLLLTAYVLRAPCEDKMQLYNAVSLYYETCFRHLDSWRLLVSASSACRILITCYPLDWASPRGELIKRIYWHCALMETALYLDLDLAPTGIINLQDSIGFPSFDIPFSDQHTYSEAYFTSLVALGRLCATIHEATTPNASHGADTNLPSQGYTGSVLAISNSLVAHLHQWRAMLPPEIQWTDDNTAGFPDPQPSTRGAESFKQDFNASLPQQPGRPLFTTDLDSDLVQYPYLSDIQVAILRTRYYYAKYMVYKPFLHKALHFPDQMQLEDMQGVSECLHASLIWPVALSPVSRYKRFIPYLFSWTQHFLNILIIIHLTEQDEMLRTIRYQLCGETFEREIGPAIEAMIDWIRDLKSSDPVAERAWDIVRGIYGVEDSG